MEMSLFCFHLRTFDTSTIRVYLHFRCCFPFYFTFDGRNFKLVIRIGEVKLLIVKYNSFLLNS